MNPEKYAQVKDLVEHWDHTWGCGPFEESLPEAEELQKLNELTGQSWDAEDVRAVCFEYSSHNSTEETVYYLFHGEYPPVSNVDLAFYRLKPGAVLDPETVYSKYCTGNQMKALIPLPMEEIVAAFQALPGWREYRRSIPDGGSHRFDCLDQPDPWSDVHFWLFRYGGRKNPNPDHLLRISCHNLSEEQIGALLQVMSGFDIPLQYREEDNDY